MIDIVNSTSPTRIDLSNEYLFGLKEDFVMILVFLLALLNVFSECSRRSWFQPTHFRLHMIMALYHHRRLVLTDDIDQIVLGI